MKILVVDDEPLARQVIRRSLARIPDVSCVGECATREETIAAILTYRPDVVLLDIRLGRTTAFDIIEQIGADAMPLVIFVTAYDQHAIKAFEVQALDYVLKPVDSARLTEALQRAAAQLSLRRGVSAAAPDAPPSRDDRLIVRDGERLAFLDLDRIEWIESAGDYVRVHSGGRAYLMRTTLDGLEHRLAKGGNFIRVRRSALINVDAVLTLERYAKGMFVIHLRGGAKVISSRYHQNALRRLLGTR
jgi:two-component system, LytTR family, response regulator